MQHAGEVPSFCVDLTWKGQKSSLKPEWVLKTAPLTGPCWAQHTCPALDVSPSTSTKVATLCAGQSITLHHESRPNNLQCTGVHRLLSLKDLKGASLGSIQATRRSSMFFGASSKSVPQPTWQGTVRNWRTLQSSPTFDLQILAELCRIPCLQTLEPHVPIMFRQLSCFSVKHGRLFQENSL